MRKISFSVNGLDELMLDLDELADLPDEVAENMLIAEAEIVEKSLKDTGRAMGVHRTGVTLGSITHGKMKSTKGGGRTMYVYPQGVNARGTRNAEVAFINEYGKKGQKARPFFRTGSAKAAAKAIDAAADVYFDHLAKKKL